MNNNVIPLRVAKLLLNALKGGVVPRTGLGHITVGRKDEVDALLHDINTVIEGGASFRFVVGPYGSGKSFLLQSIRSHAMDKGFVVMDADLSPERKLTSRKGEGLATYRELVKNLSTKASPDGGALPLLLQRWINSLKTEVMQEQLIGIDDPLMNHYVDIKIHQVINEVEGIVHGFDFAKVISLYWRASARGDDEMKTAALKWLRGEYATKTEAKNELGIGVIIGDENWYDYVKLIAMFVVQAGYKGIFIFIDELVNLYKISHPISRQNNYEKILTIYNDIMQGNAKHIGMVMGCTPQAMEDTRKGIFSYEALKSRLESSRFLDANTRDLLSPIITIKTLTPEEVYVLVEKLSMIHGQVYNYEPKLTSEDLTFFIKSEYARVGATTKITPREIIRDFIEVLNIILQNPNKTVQNVINGESFEFSNGNSNNDNVEDAFQGFEI